MPCLRRTWSLRRALATVGLAAAAPLVMAASPAAAPPAAVSNAIQGCSSATTDAITTTGGGIVGFHQTFKGGSACDKPAGPAATVAYVQQSGPPGCAVTFTPKSGTTDADGNAHTQVVFPANCAGIYVIAATADPATVTAAVREAGGFPNTSPSGGTGGRAGNSLPTILIIGGLVIAMLGLGGLVVRRRA